MAAGMMYKYPPLEHSRAFRLIRLSWNPKGNKEPSIACEFSHHSIDQPPLYSTLSYTWANPDLDNEENVICAAGSALIIQPNLAAWIKTHGVLLAGQGHLFWIDQLCIDQSNISERGDQVRLMKEIYTKSSKLFVWLGPESEESTLALETMDRAGHVLHYIYRDPNRHQLSSEEYYARGFPKPDTAAWGAVYRLFEKSYFRRVWVQQEIVASKFYEIVVQCGKASFPWAGLENTAFAMAHAKSAVEAKVYDDAATAGLQGSQMRLGPSAMKGVASFEGFRTTNPDAVNRTLYTILKSFRGYKATDPRDMIFALVGIQHDSQESIFIPDYHRSVKELYTLVTYSMITKHGLNVLREAGLPSRSLDEIPSWVIDWTFRPLTTPFVRDSQELQYSATLSSKPILYLQEGNRLLLQGLIIDVIDQCTNGTLQADERYDNVDLALGAGMFAWHQEAAQIFESTEHGACSRQPDDTALWKTLSADVSPLGGRAPPSFDDEYYKVLEYLNLLNDCDYDLSKVATMPYAKELEIFSNESIFVDAWFRAAFQRLFCSTKQGRIGLAPCTTQKGDLVAIIMGADVPFVLRSTDVGTYELVGDCYIHGVMNGEALEGKHDQVGNIVLQ